MRLSYEVEANVGGKIAQLEARLIDAVAKKNADQFFCQNSPALRVRCLPVKGPKRVRPKVA